MHISFGWKLLLKHCTQFVKASIFSLDYLNDLNLVCWCRSEAQVTTGNYSELNETDVQSYSMRTAVRFSRTRTWKNNDNTRQMLTFDCQLFLRLKKQYLNLKYFFIFTPEKVIYVKKNTSIGNSIMGTVICFCVIQHIYDFFKCYYT